MHRNHPDLLIALIITVLTLVVSLSGFKAGNIEYETVPLWMAPFGILMVLFIPGYAIISVLLPKIGSEKTLLLSLGMSISVSIVGGLILDLTPWGLTPVTCSLWLSTIAFIGIILAWHQRRFAAKSFEMGVPSLHKENMAIFGWAALILLGSVSIAYISSKQTETTFTQLWAIPILTSDGRYEIQLGIRNDEKRSEVYNVFVEIDGRRLEQWPEIVLNSNKEWITTIQLSERPSHPIRISLYRAEDNNHVYRWIRLSPEAFK